METVNFKASAQYDDWKGSVAADNADTADIYNQLKDQGLLKQNETLHAIEFYSGVNFILVTAYVGNDIKNLRKIDLEMTRDDFFRKFKRFKIALSQNGELDGQQISYE